VEGDVVRDAEGNVLLDRLHPNMSTNAALSQYGALVMGASSERGAAHAWDLTVGWVSWDCEQRQPALHAVQLCRE
jgi:hypothetical protein